jgi:hypothetical protein
LIENNAIPKRSLAFPSSLLFFFLFFSFPFSSSSTVGMKVKSRFTFKNSDFGAVRANHPSVPGVQNTPRWRKRKH